MNKYKNDFVWNEILCHHLPEDMMIEVIDLYKNCFDYSPDRDYNQIMAFVTKCFIDRNKQLEDKRSYKISKQYGKGRRWNRKILHSVKDR